MSVTILKGDCREVLKTMADESVHCVVTSPPYWGLRDYGVDGQMGLERCLGDHVDGMVDVFREVRRVLRSDGTLWLNYGDSYAASINGRKAVDIVDDDRTFRDKPFNTAGPIYIADASQVPDTKNKKADTGATGNKGNKSSDHGGRIVASGILKPKDLCGIPWRVAFALQADGWWLRQDIIWSKPNPMPESVTDRCTKAHEYIFLLSKRERYYYDAEAIAEPCSWGNGQRVVNVDTPKNGRLGLKPTREYGHQLDGGRNKRSVWEIATAPFSEAHFATFPPALIEPCIMAGASSHGCCETCGSPWEREVERGESSWQARKAAGHPTSGYHADDGAIASRDTPKPRDGKKNEGGLGWVAPKETVGWRPTCNCPGRRITPCRVLDPFGGAGTTGLVADRLGRSAILIELNPEYAAIAERRIKQDAGMFAQVHA